MEESRAILEEWENDRETTLTYVESHCDDVFDSIVLSANRTGPVLKKTVLDYRYGHYALLGLTKNFVLVYDLVKGAVSDYFLINVELQQRHWTVHRWGKVDKLRFAPQISRMKSEPATVSSHSQLTTVMYSVNQNRKTRLTTVLRQITSVPIHSAQDVSTVTCNP